MPWSVYLCLTWKVMLSKSIYRYEYACVLYRIICLTKPYTVTTILLHTFLHLAAFQFHQNQNQNGNQQQHNNYKRNSYSNNSSLGNACTENIVQWVICYDRNKRLILYMYWHDIICKRASLRSLKCPKQKGRIGLIDYQELGLAAQIILQV